MGCVSSNSAQGGSDNKSEDEATKIAKNQRRKLSVAPQHEGGGGVSGSANANRKASVMEGIGTLTKLELEGKGSLEVVSKSNKGHVPYSKKKVNQDRPMVKFSMQDDPELNLFGVMDGHGEFGHLVATYVQENLPTCLAKQKCLKDDTEKGILDGVKECVTDLPDMKINTAFSGTTCVFGVMNKSKLYVANIGDSRCVMCRQINGDNTEAIELSRDQKPEDPGEKERILAANGRVEPLPGPPGEDCGPPRVWLKDVDVPGLAMSRSIGDDVSQAVGVISVPEIKTHDVESNDIFAIWASDGVWEFMSSKEAVDLVWRYRNDLPKAVDELCGEATRRWKQEEEVIDDITAVIVLFNPPK
mmetsp:Transcript_2017/g.2708  ORF Transcript_2017/g.2708 Transcript_2017/m.2708 type:complete len:358 (-) Transcript_2017:322-1395(-)|eukprot:CAMPEP_0175097278 /NCGR_PEP_ID=MMETSP0086_2-20121207/5196_1 /TAXON_ID=136419 /ORGANISM="Unknown Unknown, Strain D1" /LENGTH=357 /DNA_ID=CAMNT_0016370767 /DNA_START=30 /DNA_END=1103 /DNA_ORIENTATION=+